MKSLAGDFEGRVALVTGASRGIGFGVAEAFAQAGAHVVLTDIATADGQAKAEQLRRAGHASTFLALDVASEADWQAAMVGVSDALGRLDVLVNAAGVLGGGYIETLELDEHRRVQSVNSDGVFLGMKTALPLLRQRREADAHASIVNISSIGALRGNTTGFSYNASKAAVIAMTRCAAIEWAALDYRVRVNAILPGAIDTDMLVNPYAHMTDPARRAKASRRAIEEKAARNPMRRIGEPADIAHAVLYLSSAKAGFVNGSTLIVDGGQTSLL